jgi:hypothetical protein
VPPHANLPRIALTTFLVVAASTWAWLIRWCSDDAWISFRYARNLARGHGLVYNVGEWVEGYTNFAWTVYVAGALRLGLEPEVAAHAGSLTCDAGIVVALAWIEFWYRDLRRAAVGRTAPPADDASVAQRPHEAPLAACRASLTWDDLPLAATVWALSPDARDWATGGLETAAFVCVAVVGVGWVVRSAHRAPGQAFGAGLLFALLAMLRPDGVLVGGLTGLWVLTFGDRRIAAGAALAAGFALAWAPFEAWRVLTYGEWVPNTYYAKSAYLTWWSQGFAYGRLFLVRYWPIVGLGIAGAAASASRLIRSSRAPSERSSVPPDSATLLFAAIALTYSAYVMRVGGDFMYARLLMPTLPFWALAASVLLDGVRRERGWTRGATALALATWMSAGPPPTGEKLEMRAGIVHEPDFYTPLLNARRDFKARLMAKCSDGLVVKTVIVGGMARMAYLADIPVVIEGVAGLTDARIAKVELLRRGRVGHEKQVWAEYILFERPLDVLFTDSMYEGMAMQRFIPEVRFWCYGIRGHLLRWDPQLVEGLRENGAHVPDYPARLDRVLEKLDEVPLEAAAGEYTRVTNFYFRWTDDPPRAAAFESALIRKGWEGNAAAAADAAP